MLILCMLDVLGFWFVLKAMPWSKKLSMARCNRKKQGQTEATMMDGQ